MTKNDKKVVVTFLFTGSEQITLFLVQHIRKKPCFFNNHRLENNLKKRVQDRACSVPLEEVKRAARCRSDDSLRFKGNYFQNHVYTW